MFQIQFNRLTSLLAATLLCIGLNAYANETKRALTLPDIMQFNHIENATISDDGKWISYLTKQDRGNSVFHLQAVEGTEHFKIDHGIKGTLSKDGRYLAVEVSQDLLTKEQATEKEKKAFLNDLVVIDLATAKEQKFNAIEAYALSDVAGFIAFTQKRDHSKKPEDASEQEQTNHEPAQDKPEQEALFNSKRIGYDLTLVNLANQWQNKINDVDAFAFSPVDNLLVYSQSTEHGNLNGLFALNLSKETNKATDKAVDASVELQPSQILALNNSSFEHLSFSHNGRYLAFLQGDFSHKIKTREHNLHLWSVPTKTLKNIAYDSANWFISNVNKLTWSQDNERLFFGFKAQQAKPVTVDTNIASEEDLYDTKKMVAKRNLQIWHGDDALIKTNEKHQLKQDKKHFYTAVYHLDDDRLVHLADKQVRQVKASNNSHAVIGSSDLNYRKLRTWEGFFNDYYVIDLEDGRKTQIAEKLASRQVKLDDSGRYAAFYQDGDIWAYDVKRQKRINLTQDLATQFANEDHDYPSKPPGYGIAGWVKGQDAVLAYDKFDIWWLSLNPKESTCLTCDMGRVNALQFRINDFDKEQDFFKPDATLLLTSYNDEAKNYGFYSLSLDNHTLTKLREENKKFRFIAKAKESDTLLFTREDFNEYPDLWVSDLNPANGVKLTAVNPQKEQFLWGQAELVQWHSSMGVKHQGVLIKPANYVEGVKYPVVVYYYRKFSQRLYEFNQMKVNHRPNFPYYSSNGYAIFLPDVHFEVGTPGHSTNKSILPGIQKIIDMGVADKNAIGLHGHSWSGYQTLHAITQTDVFAAAVSGAPVSNMTSAYSGIRLGTGLARQFQYEQGQSRIGASLFERRDLYIENSPVFFADRINTPLLIQFGDIDDAVPWQQGIEMYLAMRRLNKNVIMLQYEGEPHHLKKYPNKVDYSIKMKEYFDHYLKGKPAPLWMTEGEPYQQAKQD
ncbi:alpha/beta hydrolase family protein [Thalassotalea aquiviva]|uniref:alpha/beta hydrolase family protein n=1 Tax=Thalassotalea aquiviva TaxID=3242415 RepID=UPI00352B5FC2